MKWNKFFVEMTVGSTTTSQFFKTPMRLSTFVRRLEEDSSSLPSVTFTVRNTESVLLARIKHGYDTMLFVPSSSRSF